MMLIYRSNDSKKLLIFSQHKFQNEYISMSAASWASVPVIPIAITIPTRSNQCVLIKKYCLAVEYAASKERLILSIINYQNLLGMPSFAVDYARRVVDN